MKSARILFIISFMVALVVAWPQQLFADTGPWQGNQFAKLRLISAFDATGETDTIEAALEIKLTKGWKIYWRSPGDAGLPPEIDFTNSPAITKHHLSFPIPERFTLFGLETYGYGGQVILPLKLDLAELRKPMTARADFTGLVCSDVCVPLDAELTLYLPKGEARVSPHARAIAMARAKVPSDSTRAGVRVQTAAIDGSRLVVSLADEQGEVLAMTSGDILIESDISGYSFGRPRLASARANIEINGREASELIGKPITLTVITADYLIEESVLVTAAVAKTLVSQTTALILLVAFIGGVILNVMPCVLPVIALKLAGVMGLGGASSTLIRKSFIATAAGIIISFVALALILVAVRETGVAIGWGVQFQSPIFLIIAAIMMAVFGLMLLDKITLPTPAFAGRLVSRGDSRVMSDMSAGVMATLLATPCSAPFVGTAITFAFTAPSVIMIAVFISMGCGLASPWLLVAARPSLVHLLPSSGRWMIWLRRVLALGLFVTALWLLSLLAGHLVSTTPEDNSVWQSWKIGRAEALADQGKIVLVDVTADWCITCKANKILVFNNEAIGQFLREHEVVMLQADWTQTDADISRYLAAFDRYGVPFNVVYGPAAPGGIPLPELVTGSSIKSAIIAASR